MRLLTARLSKGTSDRAKLIAIHLLANSADGGREAYKLALALIDRYVHLRHLCLYDGQRILSGWTIFLQVGRYCICSGVCPKMTPLRLGKIPSSRRSMQPRARRNRSKSQRCASRVVHLLQLAQSALAAQEGATKARKKRFNVSVAFPLPSRA